MEWTIMWGIQHTFVMPIILIGILLLVPSAHAETYRFGVESGDKFYYRLDSVTCDHEQCDALGVIGLPIRGDNTTVYLFEGEKFSINIKSVPDYVVWNSTKPPKSGVDPVIDYTGDNFTITGSDVMPPIHFIILTGYNYQYANHEFDENGVLTRYNGAISIDLVGGGISIRVDVDVVRIFAAKAFFENNRNAIYLTALAILIVVLFMLVIWKYRRKRAYAQVAETWPKQ